MEFSIDSLQRRIEADLGDSVSVSSRGPGTLHQVDLPTFLADGDAVAVFVEPSEISGNSSIIVLDKASGPNPVEPVGDAHEASLKGEGFGIWVASGDGCRQQMVP